MRIAFADTSEQWGLGQRNLTSLRDNTFDRTFPVTTNKDEIQKLTFEFSHDQQSILVQNSTLKDFYNISKEQLIAERNSLIDSIFYNFNKKAKCRVQEIDQRLDQIEMKEYRDLRSNDFSSYLQEIRNSQVFIQDLIKNLHK
jgi:hypothetical protein